MKVLLNLVTSTSGLSGVQRHALNLASSLLQDEEIEVHIAAGSWQRSLLENYGSSDRRVHVHLLDLPRSTIGRNAWFYTRLTTFAQSIGVDLIHSTYPIPIGPNRLRIPIVVTLHDLYPYEVPQNFGRSKAILHRIIVRQCLRRVDAVACVSHATARSMSAFFGPTICAKASVVYNCVSLSGALGTTTPPISTRTPFLLAVAQHRYNKNLELLVRVFHRLLVEGDVAADMVLLIVGMKGPETVRIKRAIEAHSLRSRVALMAGISEAQLRWCYQHCGALVVPSIAEGFGLPVAEALLLGCPVVCSDIPALREVAGDRCTFVTLGRNADATFASAIAEAVRQPRPSPCELPQFSRETVAAGYSRLYRTLVEDKDSASEVCLVHAEDA